MSSAAAKKKAQDTAALRMGAVDSEAKVKHTGPANSRKLDEEDENFRHAAITTEFKTALMQARAAKGLKQKDLANQLNIPPATIQGYENGSAIPEGNVINKLNRALGVTLPKVVKPSQKK